MVLFASLWFTILGGIVYILSPTSSHALQPQNAGKSGMSLGRYVDKPHSTHECSGCSINTRLRSPSPDVPAVASMRSVVFKASLPMGS